jgi:hypothetical protein
MEQRRRFNEGVTEAQYNHNNANVKDHPTIVPKTYLAKLPKGNLDGYIVKNGNGFMVAIIDRKNKLQLSGGTTNSIRDAVFFLKKKGFDLQPLIDMGMMKPKNESVTEAKEIKWQDVEVGDSANVTATNKTGVIVKTYGRKFHLKFVDGTTKTFDANELSFVKQEGVNEGKYYIGYNKGRGQGTGVFKDVFSTYKDAKKELEKIEKQRGGSYNQIAYYVADEKGNFVREAMLGEGRGIKSIQNDLDKTVVAIESEIASYKKTKGTPQEKKHIDNLKKLHPIKKKLQSELDMAVSGLYRDAELKIED